MEKQKSKQNIQLTLDFKDLPDNQNFWKKETRIIPINGFSSKKNNITREILKRTKSW